MKNLSKFFWVTALLTAIGFASFSLAGCDKSYALGATGPGGGKVFYYSPEGFTTDTGKTCHYLEAAPSDMPTGLAWASSSFTNYDIAGTEGAIGAGKKNTVFILSIDSNAPAAKACKEYSSKGKKDWFLPSNDELEELYKARAYVGNMGNDYYWSSSQISPLGSRIYHFSGRGIQYGYKYDDNNVRAVRAF